MPTNLPESIEVDISGLAEIGDNLLVGDISAPEGVEILNDPEDVVVVVIAQAVEEVEEEEELELEEDMEPEMVERGKREEEEEEEGTPQEE